MIGYRFTEAEIIADIEADDLAKKRKTPWLKKAKALTDALRRDPKREIASGWSEVKSVYTRRQAGKCAFCERMLGEHELAAVEFDVEHFRPKNEVRPWPTPEVVDELKLPADFPRSTAGGRGYRFLAYHHLNYASSCKTCNSRLKASYFPIAGKHVFSGTDPVTLTSREQPLLIYPLGAFDDDPEEMITFQGYIAVPHPQQKSAHTHNRARVTIAFFRLNDNREDLLLLRAKQLDNVFSKIELLDLVRAKKRRREIWSDIERLASSRNDHAGCVRSLLRLYGQPEGPKPTTRAKALEYLQLARDYVRKKLPSL